MPPPQIPTIIIHESPPQDIDIDQKWESQDSSVKPEASENIAIEAVEVESKKETTEEKAVDDSKPDEILGISTIDDSVNKNAVDGKFGDTDKGFGLSCFRTDKEELHKVQFPEEKVLPVVAPLATEESSPDASISSGVNSLAREIVTDVIESAKETVLDHKPCSIETDDVKVVCVADSSSSSDKSTSSEKLENYAVLGSSSSSEAVVIDLCSPEQLNKVNNISVIDLSPPPSPEIMTEKENVHEDKTNEIVPECKPDILSNVPLFDFKKSDLDEGNLNADLVVHVENIDNLKEIDQTIMLDDSIENVLETSVTNEVLIDDTPTNPKFDESFVTLRKKRKFSDDDVFNWENENNVSLPLCYNATFIGEEETDLSLDGIYHADVVQLDTEVIEQINSKRNENSVIEANNQALISNISNDKIKIVEDSPVMNAEKSSNLHEVVSPPCLLLTYALENAKLPASVPKNIVLPASPVKSLSEKKDEYKLKDLETSAVMSDKTCDIISKKNTSKTSFVLSDEKPKSPKGINSKEETKYKGYSGSFAEKVRPKSLFCDTLYLRSLDIKLTQPFSTLTKSEDKLDDYNKIDDGDTIKKKLFSDSNDCLDVDENDLDVFDEPEYKKPVKALPVCLKSEQEQINHVISKPKSTAHKHPSVSFSAVEAYSELVSPYTSAQVITTDNNFPTKMRPKCDMDINKLKQKREKRKSVHEDIQGLPFADEEKIVSPVDPFGNDVFLTPRANLDDASKHNSQSEIEVFSTPAWKAPDLIDEERYLRLQSTAEQEKARQEARARARLKSDEELGLSPNNYRKKYRRQLSLNSINYDELCSDEFCDQDDEELEDDIISNFCLNKNLGIEETFSMFKNTDLYAKGKLEPLPKSSQQSHPKSIATSLGDDLSLLCSNISPPDKAMSASTGTLKFSDSLMQSNISKTPSVMQTSMHSSKTSSPETSPDIVCADIPPYDSKFSSKGKSKSSRTESSGDDDKSKSNGKKSIFSILNFGKGNVSKEKPKQKTKDPEKELSSSLPNDFGARSVSKSKPFSHLKLSKSKEKTTKPPKAKSVPSEDVPNCPLENTPIQEDPLTLSLNTQQAKIIPKYTVYRNPETMISTFPVHLPVPKLENGLAPKASGKLQNWKPIALAQKAYYPPISCFPLKIYFSFLFLGFVFAFFSCMLTLSLLKMQFLCLFELTLNLNCYLFFSYDFCFVYGMY